MGFIFDQYRKRSEFKFKGLGVTKPQTLSLGKDSRTIAQTMRDQKREEKKDASQV